MSRTIVITGAAGGLGTALARRFAADEATNLVLSDLSDAPLVALADECAERSEVATFAADVGDPQAVEALVTLAVSRFGRVDVMINNAGILHQPAPLHRLTPADWERTLRVNVLGVANGITAALRAMRADGEGGAIINTASVAGLAPWSFVAAYAASKAAVIQLTKVAAAEYARDGIRVNCVCPGAFQTPILGDDPDKAIEWLGPRHPLGIGVPEDVVEAFAYLASDAARWATGSALVIDGGYTVH